MKECRVDAKVTSSTFAFQQMERVKLILITLVPWNVFSMLLPQPKNGAL